MIAAGVGRTSARPPWKTESKTFAAASPSSVGRGSGRRTALRGGGRPGLGLLLLAGPVPGRDPDEVLRAHEDERGDGTDQRDDRRDDDDLVQRAGEPGLEGGRDDLPLLRGQLLEQRLGLTGGERAAEIALAGQQLAVRAERV